MSHAWCTYHDKYCHPLSEGVTFGFPILTPINLVVFVGLVGANVLGESVVIEGRAWDCDGGRIGSEGNGVSGFAVRGFDWPSVMRDSGTGGGGLRGRDAWYSGGVAIDGGDVDKAAGRSDIDDPGIGAGFGFVLSICRSLASIIAILTLVPSCRPPAPVFSKLSVVGLPVSIILFRFTPYTPTPPASTGAWCANVTTSFRPRSSLSCAMLSAFAAS